MARRPAERSRFDVAMAEFRKYVSREINPVFGAANREAVTRAMKSRSMADFYKALGVTKEEWKATADKGYGLAKRVFAAAVLDVLSPRRKKHK